VAPAPRPGRLPTAGCSGTRGGCGGLSGPGGGLGGTLDERTRRQYGERLADLEAELAEAEAFGGTERAERTRGEREWIAAELAAAYGLHGRSRLTGDPVERARQAVKWRIRHAIGRVEQAHPALGRHLRNSIRTGVFCAYLPEPTSLDRLVWCSMRPVGRPVDTASAPG